MHPPSASTLLNVWERGRGRPSYRRALMLLEAVFPEEPAETLALLPIGQRDTRLLTLREGIFGSRLESVVACPACAETLEFAFTISDIRVAPEQPIPDQFSLFSNGYEVTFRLPNTEDVADFEHRAEDARRPRLLLERCLVEVRHEDEALPADRLPESLVEAVAEQMAQADPQANVQLALTCPACEHRWQSTFDIVSYLWTETDAWARRMLRDVHVLASAYGWPEADLLAMSAWRRQFYLDLINR